MPAKDDFDLFHSVAEMLGLEDDETENFITSAMRRRGHRPRVDWDDGEGSGESGGDFFTKKRETRQVRPKPEQKRASGGGGWQYGA
jgi:hypothetical protein